MVKYCVNPMIIKMHPATKIYVFVIPRAIELPDPPFKVIEWIKRSTKSFNCRNNKQVPRNEVVFYICYFRFKSSSRYCIFDWQKGHKIIDNLLTFNFRHWIINIFYLLFLCFPSLFFTQSIVFSSLLNINAASDRTIP